MTTIKFPNLTVVLLNVAMIAIGFAIVMYSEWWFYKLIGCIICTINFDGPPSKEIHL